MTRRDAQEWGFIITTSVGCTINELLQSLGITEASLRTILSRSQFRNRYRISNGILEKVVHNPPPQNPAADSSFHRPLIRARPLTETGYVDTFPNETPKHRLHKRHSSAIRNS